MAIGIRESGLVNIIQFGYHEYIEKEENFLHNPVKIDFSDSNHTESINHQLQSTDLTDLHKVEQIFLQNQVEITTLEKDDDGNNDSATINEIIQGDLPYVDKSTLSIIQTLQIEDQKIHTGQDEETIALVNKLERERELEQRNYDNEREEELVKSLEKSEINFPKLEKKQEFFTIATKE